MFACRKLHPLAYLILQTFEATMVLVVFAVAVGTEDSDDLAVGATVIDVICARLL